MNTSNRNIIKRNSDSEDPSPSNRSRSRDKEIEKERVRNNIVHKPYHRNNCQIEGKLYLANIPLNIPQPKIIEEFGKYGRILDFSFRKKTDIQNPYYYGYITLNGKIEAENAVENITKNFNWTVMPFGKKDKNNNEKNININSFLNKKINNQEDKISSDNIIINNKLNNNLNNIIKVREIWVTNLPLSTDESKLYKEFFIYGEISKIELKTFFDKKNAFIKYRLVDSAKKAFENENNSYFNGNIININFSNENQRKDIKGNENGYELTEKNCKLIVVCLNKNIETTNEENILNVFENFGQIKNVTIKNILNRNHIFIEYYKSEDAQNSIMEMNKEKNVEKRKILGDENCEINYYYKSKFNEINPFSNKLNKNIELFQNCQRNNSNNSIGFKGINNNTALMLQILQNNLLKNQFLTNNMQNQNLINIIQNKNINSNNLNTVNINNYNKNINNINNLNKENHLINLIKNNSNNSLSNPKQFLPSINSPLYFKGFPQILPNLNPNNLLLSLLLNNPILSNIINNNFKTQINFNTNNGLLNNQQNNHNKININNSNNNINNNKTNDVKDLLKKIMLDKSKKIINSNSDSDISSLNSNQSNEEMDFDKEYSLEEENLKYIWNGYLTKNNKEKVNIDIYKIRGKIDDSYFTGYHFNICNRIHYEEVLKKHLLGIVAISPNNITQKEIFDQYINYFYEKQRCGVININEKYKLYLASPSEFSKKFYINPKKHLLGLLIDSTIEPNLYIDINNLTLPPPVISSCEKRRLMDKNRQKENKKDNFIKINKNENEIVIKLKEQLKKIDGNEKEGNNNELKELINKNPNIKKFIDELTKKADKEY